MAWKDLSQIRWIRDGEAVNGSRADGTPDEAYSPTNRMGSDLWGNTEFLKGAVDTTVDALDATVNSVNAHFDNMSIHRTLNDAAITDTNLWSASKISSEIQAVGVENASMLYRFTLPAFGVVFSGEVVSAMSFQIPSGVSKIAVYGVAPCGGYGGSGSFFKIFSVSEGQIYTVATNYDSYNGIFYDLMFTGHGQDLIVYSTFSANGGNGGYGGGGGGGGIDGPGGIAGIGGSGGMYGGDGGAALWAPGRVGYGGGIGYPGAPGSNGTNSYNDAPINPGRVHPNFRLGNIGWPCVLGGISGVSKNSPTEPTTPYLIPGNFDVVGYSQGGSFMFTADLNVDNISFYKGFPTQGSQASVSFWW